MTKKVKLQHFERMYIKSALRVNFSGVGFDSVSISRSFLINECSKADRTWYLFAYVLDGLSVEELADYENFEASLDIALDILNISYDEYLKYFKYNLIDKMSELYYQRLDYFN